MEYTATIEIPAADVRKWNKMLQSKIDYDMEKIAEFETVKSWTATFDNGFIVDVKIVANTREDADLYSEAVLFGKTGSCFSQRSCSDCGDEIDGPWYLYDGDDTYIVNVVSV